MFDEYLVETKCIDFSHPLIVQEINVLKEKSGTQLEYIENAYRFVRDEIPHSMDIKSEIVSKTASEVLKNKTGICWVKSCLLCALLRGNGIPSGLSFQKLTCSDADTEDGYIIHALNTVYVSELNKWIRLDARGNKASIHAEFSTDEEILAYPVRKELAEIDYNNNLPDLDVRLSEILNNVDCVTDIRTDFDL